MAMISPSRRLRRTPFSDGVEAAGVKGYTVYNHMLLPTVFESIEEDYRHLKEKVQVWDVACERQVELRGPDAGRLMQMLTPRDLRGMLPGQCYYVPIVDETGGMLNDPVAVKLAEDRWWISIADSDLLLWVKGIVYGFRLDVLVDEPDVSPLAVQGPHAEDLMAAVFGEGVRAVRFFRFGVFQFQGRDMVVARSGYSKQGGFEIYVEVCDIGSGAGLPGLVLLRLLPIAPYTVVNLMLGAVGIGLPRFLIGTFLGLLPGSLAATAFGHQLERLISDPSWQDGALLALVLAAAVAVLFALRRLAERWLDDDGNAADNEARSSRRGETASSVS